MLAGIVRRGPLSVLSVKIRFVANLEGKQVVPNDLFAVFNYSQVDVLSVVEGHTWMSW